jgi:hypothetical protein
MVVVVVVVVVVVYVLMLMAFTVVVVVIVAAAVFATTATTVGTATVAALGLLVVLVKRHVVFVLYGYLAYLSTATLAVRGRRRWRCQTPGRRWWRWLRRRIVNAAVLVSLILIIV